MYAPRNAHKGLQAHRGEYGEHTSQQGLLVFPLLVREIYQVCVQAAAFQKTEVAQQFFTVGAVPLTADDGQVPGDPVAPQLPPGGGPVQPVLPQGQDHVHGGPQLLRAHAQMHGGGPGHRGLEELLPVQDALGGGQSLLP